METLAEFVTKRVKYYEALEQEKNQITGKMREGINRLEELGYMFKGVETIRLNRRFYKYAAMKCPDTGKLAYVNRLGGQTIGYCHNKKIQ